MNRRLLGLAAVAAALLVPMIVSPTIAASVAQGDTSGTLPDKFDMASASRLNQAIAKLEARYPRAAGGVYLDESTGQLVLRLVESPDHDGLSTSADDAAHLESSGVGFRTQTATKTEADLRATADRMQADRNWAGIYASDVRRVGVNLYQGLITVHASAHLDEIRAAAERVAGSPVVTSFGGELVAQTTPQRRNDSAPFAGGLGVRFASNQNFNADPVDCTTGFKMIKNGSVYVSLPRHCSDSGTYWWNATKRVLRTSVGYGGVGGIDAELLVPSDGDTFSNNEWWGDPTTTTAYPVTGRYSTQLPAGAKVYISGGNGGLVWGYLTGSTFLCYNPLDGINYGMVEVDTSASFKATLGGDSGAPVMIWNTSTPDTHDVLSVAMHNCGDAISTEGFTYMYRLEALSGATVATS